MEIASGNQGRQEDFKANLWRDFLLSANQIVRATNEEVKVNWEIISPSLLGKGDGHLYR